MYIVVPAGRGAVINDRASDPGKNVPPRPSHGPLAAGGKTRLSTLPILSTSPATFTPTRYSYMMNHLLIIALTSGRARSISLHHPPSRQPRSNTDPSRTARTVTQIVTHPRAQFVSHSLAGTAGRPAHAHPLTLLHRTGSAGS